MKIPPPSTRCLLAYDRAYNPAKTLTQFTTRRKPCHQSPRLSPQFYSLKRQSVLSPFPLQSLPACSSSCSFLDVDNLLPTLQLRFYLALQTTRSSCSLHLHLYKQPFILIPTPFDLPFCGNSRLPHLFDHRSYRTAELSPELRKNMPTTCNRTKKR